MKENNGSYSRIHSISSRSPLELGVVLTSLVYYVQEYLPTAIIKQGLAIDSRPSVYTTILPRLLAKVLPDLRIATS